MVWCYGTPIYFLICCWVWASSLTHCFEFKCVTEPKYQAHGQMSHVWLKCEQHMYLRELHLCVGMIGVAVLTQIAGTTPSGTECWGQADFIDNFLNYIPTFFKWLLPLKPISWLKKMCLVFYSWVYGTLISQYCILFICLPISYVTVNRFQTKNDQLETEEIKTIWMIFQRRFPLWVTVDNTAGPPWLHKGTAVLSFWKKAGGLIGLLLEKHWSCGFAGRPADYPPATSYKVNVQTSRRGLTKICTMFSFLLACF